MAYHKRKQAFYGATMFGAENQLSLNLYIWLKVTFAVKQNLRNAIESPQSH